MVPLDLESQTPPDEPGDTDELDWCFDDPELTRSLRAVKSGRGATIAFLVAATATLVTALVVLG